MEAGQPSKKKNFPKYNLGKTYFRQIHQYINKYWNFHENLTLISFFIEFKKKKKRKN